MSRYPAPCVNGPSPWGRIQSARVLARTPDHFPVAVLVSTAGHGGVWVSPDVALSRDARAYAAAWSHGHGSAWFEEDCAVAFLVVERPEWFPDADPEAARATVAWAKARCDELNGKPKPNARCDETAHYRSEL